jgi:hypothetical protein
MHKLEWPCRILLLAHCILALMGYIAFVQTKYQLVSPLISSSTVFQIVSHSILASLPAAALLIVSLLFYFFQKRLVVVILSSIAIISYFLFANIELM